MTELTSKPDQTIPKLLGNAAKLNVGIVHDWFPTLAGGERVVEQMVQAYPNSKIYGLFDFLTESERQEIVGPRQISVSRLNSLPGVKKYYRYLIMQCTRAIEDFDLTQHDIVLTSSAALAKGVLTAPGQRHVAYIHSPARYAWDMTHEYINGLGGFWGALKRHKARRMMHDFRIWDMRTPPSIDLMIANSKFIAQRIKKVYGRDSIVVYPPVKTDDFSIGTSSKENFYLTASRMVPYKKIELIASAFTGMPDRRLVIIGDGPEMHRVKTASGSNVEILGYQNFNVLRDYMQRAKAFIFAAQEDFGIVPLEAQACGTPVIALGSGGTAETIQALGYANKPTGVWFHRQEAAEIQDAVKRFEAAADCFEPETCRANAMLFGAERFRNELQFVIERGEEVGYDQLLRQGVPHS